MYKEIRKWKCEDAIIKNSTEQVEIDTIVKSLKTYLIMSNKIKSVKRKVTKWWRNMQDIDCKVGPTIDLCKNKYS